MTSDEISDEKFGSNNKFSENVGDKTESMEDELISDPTETTLQQIHSMKREMISLRKSI